jgi:hypothetical protein
MRTSSPSSIPRATPSAWSTSCTSA